MLTDIANRKNHEEQQWQYTEQISHYADEIKQIYDYAPCGYCSIDKNGYFLHINKMALKWLEFRNDDVVNKVRFQELLSVPSLDKFLRICQEAMTNSLKHADATMIMITLSSHCTLISLMINDNGVGKGKKVMIDVM